MVTVKCAGERLVLLEEHLAAKQAPVVPFPAQPSCSSCCPTCATSQSAPASLYRNVSRFRFLYLSKNRIDYEGDTFEIEMLESLNQNVTVRTIQDLSEVAAERQSVRLKSISHNFRNENLLVHLNEKKNLAKSSILRESPPDLRTFSRPSKVLSADAARSRLSRAYVCT
jgi:hypothetical protein